MVGLQVVSRLESTFCVSKRLENLNSSKLNNRLFGQWSFRTLNLAVSRMQEFTTSEPIDVVVSICLVKIFILVSFEM